VICEMMTRTVRRVSSTLSSRRFEDQARTADEDATGADAGDGAAEDENVHARRDAAEERAELEEADEPHEDALGWRDGEELAEEEDEAGLGEEVCGG
jgi:hypothetical protein